MKNRFNQDEASEPQLVEMLFVNNFSIEVTEVRELTGPDQARWYSVGLRGQFPGQDEEKMIGLALTPMIAAMLCGRLARVATQACDESFVSALMVGLTESAADSRQHLSQHLGHEDAT